MKEAQSKHVREWAAAWSRSAPELERIRREELRAVDTVSSLTAMLGLFQSACWMHRPAATSGLVEQQAWFQKCRAR